MIISCEHVTKRFVRGRTPFDALCDVSLTVEKGRITGLLGPDGAGKSTLLRVLAGLLRPDAGRAHVLGFDTVKDAAKIQAAVGYMPQKFGLYDNLTVQENLELYAGLHNVPKDVQKKRFAELLDLTNLARFTARPFGKLSGGMKSKLALACALVPAPEVLILDEPTVGVDVLSRRELWRLLKRVARERGTTVLVSTSYMDEAAACDERIFLHEGRREEPFVGPPLPPLKRANPPADAGGSVIDVRHLVKRFGSFTAVDDLSFTVRRGEIFGLLGANGAGKTTTFRMMCGLDPITAGEIFICGLPARRMAGAARDRFCFMSEKFSIYTDLTVGENLRFFAGAYGLRGARLKARLAWAEGEFKLGDYADTPAAELPLGVKQRLSMAVALLHEPEILFLDEATSGADARTRRDFWARIMRLADAGVSVVITTHFLDEAEYCDRLVILQDGRVLAEGTVADIHRAGGADTVEEAFVNLIRRRRAKEGEP